ncbi:hypothetical protein DFJ74DRAFT_287896 [Hyaloraphidium curvatum]|nr:hypothetical protein DFJ74DRAFT_287896 [Hyaloraphidium curvatum]
MASLERIENGADYSPAETAAVRARAAMKLSVVSPSTKPGQTGLIRNLDTPQGAAEWHVDTSKTVWDIWLGGVELARKATGAGFGTRSGSAYVWETYDDVHRRALALGTALQRVCGLKSGSLDSMVGLMLPNGSPWYTTDVACVAYDFVSAPLYTTSDDDFAGHIIVLCDLRVVFCSAANTGRMVRLKREGKVPTLQHLVIAGPMPPESELAEGRVVGLVFHEYERFLQTGAANVLPPKPAKDPKAPFSIISTSGTTGKPKGSILNHANFVYIVNAANGPSLGFFPEASKDISYSYLPSAHVGDRWGSWSWMSRGVPIAFGSNGAVEMFSDVQICKPTFFGFVPRVLNRLVAQVRTMVDAEGPEARSRFDAAYTAKRRLMLEQGIVTNDSEHDRPGGAFHKFQQLIGGRVRCWFIGAAAIDGAVLEFARVVFGVKVSELYGQTETTGLITSTGVNNPYGPFGSTVGVPLHYVDVILKDVPELGYTSRDSPNPRGEICCRGPNAFAGYYKEPGKTAETIDGDGFVMTGDVAELLPDGTFRIIDRSKNVFKLSQGEYVAPEKIEAVLLRSPWIAQTFVYGELAQRWLVAVFVPDPERVAGWAKDKKKSGSLKELCSDPDLVKLVMEEVIKTGKQNGLLGFEIPKAIALHPDPFTPEEGLITPSMKNKRPQLRERFLPVLKRLYDSVQE